MIHLFFIRGAKNQRKFLSKQITFSGEKLGI